MIDIIINEVGGITVAHDERKLDNLTHLVLNMRDGQAVLSGEAEECPIGFLQASMMEMLQTSRLKTLFSQGKGVQMIRLNGYNIAKVSSLVLTQY